MSMNKDAKKLRKRKAREKENKLYFLEKRLATRRAERAVREDEHKEEDHKKLVKQIDTMEEQYRLVKDKLSPEVREQIERNIEVLASLEDEHEKETEQKRFVNAQLEKEGAFELKEKMDLLSDKEKELVEASGGAECSFVANSET